MTMIDALMGRTTAPRGALAMMFGGRKAKRHTLPKWAAQKAAKK